MARAIDANFLIRGFFLHCYIHIIKILRAQDVTHAFSSPHFPLFKKLTRKYKSGSNSLFKNIAYTYKWDIGVGAIVTVIYVCFNMLVPELIKMFLHFLHGHHTENREVRQAEKFIKMLVGVQVLRAIFGEHTRRLFHELAIKVESSLAKMLVVKSLNLTQKARKDIPSSEILQLENVDLRLVWIMFNNMYFIFEAPLTILIALTMLFVEDKVYGFIGVYWFLIAFLLHRELDENMTHCNATKLGLIEKRSKINYEILEGIKEAKLIGWEDIIIEKNNDLFEVENHDHYLFYYYNCLYDIILLMLPILVVVTIGLWDVGEAKPIKVEQVYLMLSLLGLCYQPMKAFRTISISFHDGLHSLNRLQQYFDMPEQETNDYMTESIEKGHLLIAKDTTGYYPNTIFDFFIKVDFQVEMKPGERLIVVCQKGQGSTSFINLINGYMNIGEGEVRINGQVGFMSQNFFFLKSRVRDNIAFYNEHVSQEEIDRVADQLGLTHDLKSIGGLNAIMEDLNIFTKSQLQRISLARVLCSSASFYIMDSPYEYIDKEHERVLQELLRLKQEQEGVTVIMAISHLDFINPSDKVAIIEKGTVTEYGVYQDMATNLNSNIGNFFKSKEQKEDKLSSIRKQVIKGGRQAKTSIFQSLQPIKLKMETTGEEKAESQKGPIQSSSNSIKSAIQAMLEEKITGLRQVKQYEESIAMKMYFKDFVFCVPLLEIGFICMIICCAELLHVFIHFWIGHLEEEHGDNSYLNFRYMIIIEVLLTLGLAGILYYEGEVSSQIAIMQGNSIYKESLTNLIKKRISWFASEYSVKIADRFNHDYEEVFIACHKLLGIYKNAIILIVTVFFISSDGFTAVAIFSTIFAFYTSIFWVFRSVEKKIVKHYYDYKYGFVKCFEESLEGADYFRVFGSKKKLVTRAENKYRSFAAYKQAERYTSHGLAIVCDLTSNMLLAAVVYYSLQMQIHNNRSNLALIATSIHLLMNGSQVLKNIVKETISFQTFFLINLVPFLEMNSLKFKKSKASGESKIVRDKTPLGHTLNFDGIVLKEPGEISVESPLTMTILQGEHLLIFDTSDTFRNLIMYALTQNIGMIASPEWYASQGTISIGGSDIRSIQSSYLFKTVGVIMNQNFYVSGTLRENLVRKAYVEDRELQKYVRQLKIDLDLEDYDLHGLDSLVHFENSKVNFELTRKFALVRILINKSKIVIIKDTSAFLGTLSIYDVLKKYIPTCTVIKLSNKIENAFNVDRILSIENGAIGEDGDPKLLVNIPTSKVGRMLKDANLEGYLFMHRVSRAKLDRNGLKNIGLKRMFTTKTQ